MEPPAPPTLRLSSTELARSGLEATRLAFALRGLIRASPPGDGHPVLALPGYGGGDGSMAVVRYFLQRIGYAPRRLGVGVNVESAEQRIMSIDDALAFREAMVERVRERVREISDETGRKISLLGWSMGGLYAFDAARLEPDRVRMVITLGSPYGDPRGTSLFKLLRWLNGSDVPLEAQDFAGWLAKRELHGAEVPIRILYSRRDGIVAPEVAQIPDHPSVESFEIDSTHIGFCLNPEALREVARQLGS